MGKIAFVFAGQGSQYPGMGKEIYDNSEAGRKVFETADCVRSGISDMCFNGSKEDLSVTINTQPALFAVDLACAKALEEKGISPDAVAGFSLGEIPALTFAGAFSIEDGFKLVVKRAELMHAASINNPGAMAAVLKLENSAVEELCEKTGGVYPVNYNCGGQLVCAGTKESIDKLVEEVSVLKGRAMPLAVSGAFHCPHMDSAAEGMSEYLENKEMSDLTVPVYANVTALPYTGKELISKQINNSVKWQQTVENMINDGFDTFIEVGAGKTLAGLIKKISREVKIYNVQTYEDAIAVSDELKGE